MKYDLMTGNLIPNTSSGGSPVDLKLLQTQILESQITRVDHTETYTKVEQLYTDTGRILYREIL